MYNAIWRTKTVDVSVTVLRYIGKIDKRHYVAIEGSAAGVPLDELMFIVDGGLVPAYIANNEINLCE